MCAQTMLDNGCVMQEMIDNVTKGEAKVVNFYNPGHENDHIYTAAHKWNEEGGNFFGDVPAMCRLLSKRGPRAADLLLGADVYDAVMNLEKVQRLLDKNSGIIIGQIEQQLSAYDGVVYGGTLNFRGYKLNLISVDETYVDSTDKEQSYFPKTDAVITAPGSGLRSPDVWCYHSDQLRRHHPVHHFWPPCSEVQHRSGKRHSQDRPEVSSSGCTQELHSVDSRQEHGRLSPA